MELTNHPCTEVGHYPLITKYALYFHATLVPGTVNKYVRFHYIPYVVLWNPYNASMPAQDYYVRYNFGYQPNRGILALGYSYQDGAGNVPWIGPGAYDYKSGTIQNKSLDFSATGLTAPSYSTPVYRHHNNTAFMLRVECPEIPAGEAIIFSPKVSGGVYHTELKETVSDLNSGSHNVLTPGYRTNASFYSDSTATLAPPGAGETLHGRIYALDDEEVTITMAKTPEDITLAPIFMLDRLRHYGLDYANLFDGREFAIQDYPGANIPFVEDTTPDPNFPAKGVMSWMKFTNNFFNSSDLDGKKVSWLANFNPRGQVSGPSILDEGWEGGAKHAFYDIPNWTSVCFQLNSVTSAFGDEQVNGDNAYVGYSDSPDVTSCILYDVFKSKSDFTSIGNLAHGYFHNFYNKEALSGTMAQDTAGYLDSSTVLQRLGSSWNVRSDTFRIRVRGSAFEPDGLTEESHVYCEAIVRRTVDKVDLLGNETTYSNTESQWGRKYEVIFFRWLNKTEENL